MEYKNRIQETTQTTGTGALVLNGATPGYKRFGGTNGFTNNQTLRYLLEEDGPQRRWELGIGTYNATNNTLSRTQVFENNSGTPQIAPTQILHLHLPLQSTSKNPAHHNTLALLLTFGSMNPPIPELSNLA